MTGGTVRDIMCGMPPGDLDIVTSMPLVRLAKLGRSMCPGWPEPGLIALHKGRHEIGEAPPTGTLMDISVFKKALPGSAEAVFGSEFESDLSYRDFSVNSLYFDPITQTLFFDPSGKGLEDLTLRVLRPMYRVARLTQKQRAKVGLRAVRFVLDGFNPSVDSIEAIASLINDGTLGAMPHVELLAEFKKTQVMKKRIEIRRRLKDCWPLAKFFSTDSTQKNEWGKYFAGEEKRSCCRDARG